MDSEYVTQTSELSRISEVVPGHWRKTESKLHILF